MEEFNQPPCQVGQALHYHLVAQVRRVKHFLSSSTTCMKNLRMPLLGVFVEEDKLHVHVW